MDENPTSFEVGWRSFVRDNFQVFGWEPHPNELDGVHRGLKLELLHSPAFSVITKADMSLPIPQYVIAIVPPGSVSRRLQERFAFDVIEPHITIKAQPGLVSTDRERWLKRVEGDLAGFGSIQISLGHLNSFGDSVSYLPVNGSRVLALHERLMEIIQPAASEAGVFHELTDWTPHLTLEQVTPMDRGKAEEFVASARIDSHFQVDSVWLFRHDQPGSRYIRDTEIALISRVSER
jgi:2'-5' RNA ligase